MSNSTRLVYRMTAAVEVTDYAGFETYLGMAVLEVVLIDRECLLAEQLKLSFHH